MDTNKKKIAAAISAVLAYIKTEEDVLYAQQMGAAAGLPATPAAAPVKLWGISGRQEQMQLRGLMQLRSFKGTHFR